MFSLKLLGGASIEGDGRPLTGRAVQRRRLALLAILASARSRGVARDKLVAWLWPESDAERGRHLLSDSVYRINQALGGPDSDAIVAVGDELRLDAGLLRSDLTEFEDALERRDWARAVALYAGPFLDGFFISEAAGLEQWLELERARHARSYAAALEALAREADAADEPVPAVAWWRRLAAHDPYNSRVAVGLMQALARAGERAAALELARVHELLLREEMGVPQDAAVAALAAQLRLEARTAGSVDAVTGGDGSRRPATDSPPPVAGGHDSGSAHAAPPPEELDAHRAVPPVVPRRRRSTLAGVVLLTGFALLAAWLIPKWTAGDGPPPVPSIAVLPFADVSPARDQEYFSDGMTEELINALSRVAGLHVASRTSAFAFKRAAVDVREVGRRLAVATVLEGSVRRADSTLRIDVRLVSAHDGYQLWTETYERPVRDVFVMQKEIARDVVGRLKGRLVASAAPAAAERAEPDLEAYNLYLRGRHSLYLKGRYSWFKRTEQGLRDAAAYFEQAVAKDPSYARAHAGLADAYAVLGFYDYAPPLDVFPRAEASARQALALDSSLAQPRATLGYVELYHRWNWVRAEEHFERAIGLDPRYSTAHQWYANLLTVRGRFAEAEREMRRAQEIDPLSLIASAALGWVYYYAGDVARAEEQCRQTLELDKEYVVAMLWRGWALQELARVPESVAVLEQAAALTGNGPVFVAALARALAVNGDTSRARALLAQLDARSRRGYVPSYDLAKVHLALGDRARALDLLERAYRERSHSMVFLRVDPQLNVLRGEARMEALAERVGARGR